jgi:SAM-dependent methyltransferase
MRGAESSGRGTGIHLAEWYEQRIGDAPQLIAALSGLLPAVTCERVPDIACGQGRMSRYLARLGADVAGAGISGGILSKARATGPQHIAYVRAGITRHPAAVMRGELCMTAPVATRADQGDRAAAASALSCRDEGGDPGAAFWHQRIRDSSLVGCRGWVRG